MQHTYFLTREAVSAINADAVTYAPLNAKFTLNFNVENEEVVEAVLNCETDAKDYYWADGCWEPYSEVEVPSAEYKNLVQCLRGD